MNLHSVASRETPAATRGPSARLRLLAGLLLLAGLSGVAAEGCASETPKAGLGEKCEESAQCDRTKDLVCRCVRRKSADEEGPEQILAPGVCQVADYKCPPADAGPLPEVGADTGVSETTADAPSDGSDADATEAATDGGSDAAAETADTGDG